MSFFDPYAYEVPKLDTTASNMILLTPHETNNIVVGIKSMRIWNPNVAAASIVVQTLVGEIVTFLVPPQSLWVEPIRIRKLLTATTAGCIIHGYTDRASTLSELPLDA